MAQAQIYTKRAQIQVREETVQDTYEAPSGDNADFFLGEIPDSPLTLTSTQTKLPLATGNFLMPDDVVGGVSATITFRVPLKGSGTAGTAPEFSEALKACGMEHTNTAVTSDEYVFVSTFDSTGGLPHGSYSVTILENGVRYAIAGAFGTFTITAPVGQPAMIDFTFTGAFQAVADDGLEAPTYQTTIPPAFQGASLSTIGSYTPVGVANLTFDAGNQIYLIKDANATYGVTGARITSRDSGGSIDPDMTLVATNDFFGDWLAGTTGALTTGTVGGTAGNQWLLSFARAQYEQPALATREGTRSITCPFRARSLLTDAESPATLSNADVYLLFT